MTVSKWQLSWSTPKAVDFAQVPKVLVNYKAPVQVQHVDLMQAQVSQTCDGLPICAIETSGRYHLEAPDDQFWIEFQTINITSCFSQRFQAIPAVMQTVSG